MWLSGVYHLGAILGNFLFGILLNYFGRTKPMSLLALPNIIFWVTVLLANNFSQLVVGRFVGGLTGGLFVCIPSFVAEIANKELVKTDKRFFFDLFILLSAYRIRGFLGVMGPLIVAVGILFAYICGAFVEFRLVPYCIIAVPVLFFIVMQFMPETPHALLRRKHLQEIEKESLKGLLSGVALVVISIFSGIIVMTMHAAQLFIDSGAVFSASLSAIILGLLQVCGIYVSSMLVDRVGRRILLGISSLGAAISLFVFGTFSYLINQGYELSFFDWVPVVSGSFYIFINCVGIKPMPSLYVAEILPDNVRDIGLSICMMVMTMCTSISVFTLPLFVDLFGLYAVMWGYG
ncbi:Facilitated trehalose transporter Tret1, partial [Pseudolycoriella hygida]